MRIHNMFQFVLFKEGKIKFDHKCLWEYELMHSDEKYPVYRHCMLCGKIEKLKETREGE